MDKNLWTGRKDGLRVHHIIKNTSKPCVGLLGFASDEGVKRNLGREGALKGPDAFRKAFANIPVHDPDLIIKDCGDIVAGKDLEKAQMLFQKKIKELWKKGTRPFAIGGGHEISYPHYKALTEVFPNETIGIINFDAHLDLRSPINGNLSTSGSSFFQIHEMLQKKPFHYLCIGAQKFSNTADLWDRLKEFKGKALLAEEVVFHPKKALQTLNVFLKKVDKVYLTVDLDVFSAPCAPGVSAPNPFGLTPYDVLPLLHSLKNSGKMLTFDIAELNPHYDIDGRTAKLAALIAMELL